MISHLFPELEKEEVIMTLAKKKEWQTRVALLIAVNGSLDWKRARKLTDCFFRNEMQKMALFPSF